MIYCINVILDRMDYSDVLGYIVSYFYVAKVGPNMRVDQRQLRPREFSETLLAGALRAGVSAAELPLPLPQISLNMNSALYDILKFPPLPSIGYDFLNMGSSSHASPGSNSPSFNVGSSPPTSPSSSTLPSYESMEEGMHIDFHSFHPEITSLPVNGEAFSKKIADDGLQPELDCDAIRMMFRTEHLGEVAGPTIELKDNNMGLTQRYDSKQFILVAKCSKGYILMNRLATEEMYLRLCVGLSANAIVAVRGTEDTLCRNRGDGPSQKFMQGFLSVRVTSLFFLWYGGKVPLPVAMKWVGSLGIDNTEEEENGDLNHLSYNSYDIGFTHCNANNVMCFSPMVTAPDLLGGATTDIYEMFNGLLGNQNRSIGGGVTYHNPDKQHVEKVILYSHLVHNLKQLKKFEWLRVTRGHDYRNRSISFHGLLEAVKDPNLYLGGFRIEATYQVTRLDEINVEELRPPSLPGFLKAVGLGDVEMIAHFIPRATYLRHVTTFCNWFFNESPKGQGNELLSAPQKRKLYSVYNAFGMHKPDWGHEALTKQDDPNAFWKTLSAVTLRRYGMRHFQANLLDVHPGTVGEQVAQINQDAANPILDLPLSNEVLNVIEKVAFKNHPKNGRVVWLGLGLGLVRVRVRVRVRVS
jgi:hypothetical protein